MKKILWLFLLLPMLAFSADQRTLVLVGGNPHPIENWSFTNAASRTGASGFANQDIGKVGYQADTNQYYRLTGISPTWQSLPTGPLVLSYTDAVNNAITNVLTIDHETSGTPANGMEVGLDFKLPTSTTSSVDAGQIGVRWIDVTNASKTSTIVFYGVNHGTLGEVARMNPQNGGGGSFSVGQGVDPGAGIINANAGFVIGNVGTTSGKMMQGNGSNFVTSTSTWPTSATAGNVPYATALNTYADTDIAAWTIKKVVTSDATTTGQSLVDVTGLVSATLTASALYEFEAVLKILSSSAAGNEYGINVTGTVAGTCLAFGTATGSAVTVRNELVISAVNTATAAQDTGAIEGLVTLKGWFVAGTGTSAMSIQHLKVTSGTSTVRVGSILKYRKM